ncbi:MAG: MFS transporter [Clostridia bacterium]|nr:MFS transporter [Clostridia bacterium]
MDLIRKVFKETPSGWATNPIERKSYYAFFLGQNAIYALVTSYLTTYFMLIGVDLTKATGIMLAIKIWDAVNDCLFGVIFDMVKFKSGKKYLPWLRMSLVLITVTTVLMFAAPFRSSSTTKLVWFAISYLIWDSVYTLCDVPIYGIITSMTKNIAERNAMMSYKSIWGGAGSTVTTVVVTVLISEKVGSNYTVVALVVAIIAFITMLPSCLKLEERYTPPQEDESFTVRGMFSYLFKNKYLLIFYIGFFFYSSVNIAGALNLWVSFYLFNNTLFSLVVGALGVAPSIILSLLTPKILTKIDKMKLFKLSTLLTIILSVIMWLVGYKSIAAFAILSTLRSIPQAIFGVVLFMFTPDCAEYGRYKTGIDAKGITFAIQTFMCKLTGAISGSVSLLWMGLEYTGWITVEAENFEQLQELNVQQSPHALNVLWFVYVMVPAIGYLCSYLVWMLYKLNDKDVQIMADCNAGKITREEAENQLSRKY